MQSQTLLQRRQGREHGFQARLGVVAEVHAQGAAAVVEQGLQVAEGLGILEGAEGVGAAGQGQVLGVIVGELNEQAGVGAALVVLAGAVQEAWAVARGGGQV